MIRLKRSQAYFEARPNTTRHLLAHELIHIAQAKHYGWTYLPRYCWQAVRHGLFGGKHNVPWERQAYDLGSILSAEGEVYASYAECVRRVQWSGVFL